MAVSDDEIAAVRTATDLVALISETVALKRVGRRWSGLCPFHSEKTPSFSVNGEEGRYYCFGCRASGDAITWVREHHHLDFIDALRLLADRAGIELHDDASTAPARKERQALLEAMERAVAWYHERLLNDSDARPAREYLRSRGITGEVARSFQLGWAPDEWDAMSRSLDLAPRILEGAGLGFVNARQRRQDAMRGRIIFPIFDTTGRAIALGGRILPSLAERGDGRVEAKYKNSAETSIYQKRRTLYGLNLAKDDVVRSGEIIVCEGYTDVIAFFQVGLARAVATCGTALGEEHFTVMRNFAKRIVLAYDADGAGQSAAASVYQWERQHEVDVAVAHFPAGADPAELAQRDPDALRHSIASAVPFLEFRLNRVLDSASLASPEGRARAAERACEVLAEHPNELVRDQYVMTVADRLRLDPQLIRSRVEGERSGRPRPAPRPRESVAAPVTPRPGLEVLRLCVHRPDLVVGLLDSVLFTNPIQRTIFDAITSFESTATALDALEAREEFVAAGLLSEIVVEDLELTYDAGSVDAVVAQLVRAAASAELEQLPRDLRSGTVTAEQAQNIIRDVKARLSELDSPTGDRAVRELRDWLIEREGLLRR